MLRSYIYLAVHHLRCLWFMPQVKKSWDLSGSLVSKCNVSYLHLHLLPPQFTIRPRLKITYFSRAVSQKMTWAVSSMPHSEVGDNSNYKKSCSYIQPSLYKTSPMLAIRNSESYPLCYLCSFLKNRVQGKKSHWDRSLRSWVLSKVSKFVLGKMFCWYWLFGYFSSHEAR